MGRSVDGHPQAGLPVRVAGRPLQGLKKAGRTRPTLAMPQSLATSYRVLFPAHVVRHYKRCYNAERLIQCFGDTRDPALCRVGR
jgi:hypothetical protein